MGKLDAKGVIAVLEVIIYIPILCTSLFLVKRHGFKRTAGWIFFVLFSLVRIVGAIVHIVSEASDSTSSTVHIIYSILEGAGLQPLLGAILGFLGTIAQNGLDTLPIVTFGLRLLVILSSVALALSIAGGVEAGNATTINDLNNGIQLRHIGVILFLVLYILIIFTHGFFWSQKEAIMKYRRKLLLGISLALPFLGVRVLYTVLSGFAPVTLPGTAPATGGLSRFNNQTGSWATYLFMSVLAELASVLIYMVFGITTPLSRDYSDGNGEEELTDLNVAPFRV